MEKGFRKGKVISRQLVINDVGHLCEQGQVREYLVPYEEQTKYDCKYVVRSFFGTVEVGWCNYNIDAMTNLSHRAEKLYGDQGNVMLIIDADNALLHEIDL